MSVAPSPSTPTTEDRMAEEYNKTMAHAMKVGSSGEFGTRYSGPDNPTCYWKEVAQQLCSCPASSIIPSMAGTLV